MSELKMTVYSAFDHYAREMRRNAKDLLTVASDRENDVADDLRKRAKRMMVKADELDAQARELMNNPVVFITKLEQSCRRLEDD